jgi:hypothetical protein
MHVLVTGVRPRKPSHPDGSLGSDMPSALNNREWATVIWLAIGLIWMLTRADVRAMLSSLVRNLFQRKLFAC